jgi:hypothetical protein
MWRFAVLAAAALLVSGQLCMLTTCVPRLQRSSSNSTAHECCHAVPSSHAPAQDAPTPAGAMPCDESLNLAAGPTLDTPALAVSPLAVAATIATPRVDLAPIAFTPIERDTGPSPGRPTSAPTGLRAPPRA